tara:strand:+ start:2815 stop:3741 length:927 start_codon:yes stop_codon:yes gene_type:complete
MIKKILLIIIILIGCFTYSINASVYINVTVDGEIITNIDIDKESEYLKILNPNLKLLKNEKILEISKNSLINQIIKKKEVLKFIDINKENPFVDEHLKNLYSKLNYNNEKEFRNDLVKKNNYRLDEIRQKIKIELYWNELIYTKFNNLIKINKKELKKKINNLEDKDYKEYLLYEIVFNKQKNLSLEDLIKQIKLSIKEIGFNNTANIYSISDSSKFGGKIGWVNENSLSSPILKKLDTINEGDYSEIIKIGNNFLILKVDQIRLNKIELDKEKELEKLIQIEKNKQLNQFSRIYFDKSKINYSINEK